MLAKYVVLLCRAVAVALLPLPIFCFLVSFQFSISETLGRTEPPMIPPAVYDPSLSVVHHFAFYLVWSIMFFTIAESVQLGIAIEANTRRLADKVSRPAKRTSRTQTE